MLASSYNFSLAMLSLFSIISLTECGWTVHLNVAGQLSLSPYRTGPTYKKAEVPASGTPFVQLVVLTRTYFGTTLCLIHSARSFGLQLQLTRM